MNLYINIISNWTWQWRTKIDSDSILQSQDLGTAFQALERLTNWRRIQLHQIVENKDNLNLINENVFYISYLFWKSIRFFKICYHLFDLIIRKIMKSEKASTLNLWVIWNLQRSTKSLDLRVKTSKLFFNNYINLLNQISISTPLIL